MSGRDRHRGAGQGEGELLKLQSPAEVVVVDVGSQAPESAEGLARAEAAGVTVLRAGPTPQGPACDRAASRAGGEASRQPRASAAWPVRAPTT